MRVNPDPFTQGYAVAAAHVKRSFDEPGIAYDLLATAGITTLADVRALKLMPFDNKQLRIIIKSEAPNGGK